MNVLDDSLREAARTTFEQLVFLLPDVPPDAQQRARRVRAIATIAFSGPARGALEVRACEGLLPRLTARLVPDASESLQLDALGEIANIICAQMFAYLDPASIFEQTPPEVSTCGDSCASRLPDVAAEAELGLDSSRAEIRLYLFSSAA
jgi:hypothetical protein